MRMWQPVSCAAFLVSLATTPMAAIAAEKTVLFGNNADGLNSFSIVPTEKAPHGVLLPNSVFKNSPNTLQLVKAEKDSATQLSHARYAQYYQGIPVYGYQVIYHISPNGKTMVTGIVINNIAKDVKTLQPSISVEKATQLANSVQPIRSNLVINKIIYFNSALSNKAVLAYYISYIAQSSKGPSAPVIIMDATSGKVIQQWNNIMDAAAPSTQHGTGTGGLNFRNGTPGDYCPGSYYFGEGTTPPTNPMPSAPQNFSPMKVGFNGTNTCVLINPHVQVIGLDNQTESELTNAGIGLPVPLITQASIPLTPFTYSCDASTGTGYMNTTDGNTCPGGVCAPLDYNGGYSPNNELFYFATKTMEMYIDHYGIAKPIGSKDLPMRAYDHVANYANAFAYVGNSVETVETKNLADDNNSPYIPQQTVYGNGTNNPTTGDASETDVETVGHEASHLVTAHASKLVYANESGGMNESFSDAAAFALKDYLRSDYPWIWNGTDWRFGFCISKNQQTMRYLNNPPEDGNSIDNQSNYEPGMDVHYSSGLFNKAFYLLSSTTGWTPDTAFQVYLRANLYYWIPNSTFDYGSCGVEQAASDLGKSVQDVVNAFAAVNVHCEVGGKSLFAK